MWFFAGLLLFCCWVFCKILKINFSLFSYIVLFTVVYMNRTNPKTHTSDTACKSNERANWGENPCTHTNPMTIHQTGPNDFETYTNTSNSFCHSFTWRIDKTVNCRLSPSTYTHIASQRMPELNHEHQFGWSFEEQFEKLPTIKYWRKLIRETTISHSTSIFRTYIENFSQGLQQLWRPRYLLRCRMTQLKLFWTVFTFFSSVISI